MCSCFSGPIIVPRRLRPKFTSCAIPILTCGLLLVFVFLSSKRAYATISSRPLFGLPLCLRVLHPPRNSQRRASPLPLCWDQGAHRPTDAPTVDRQGSSRLQ
ncbi:hypothetical protein NDU88_004738 [Pleurodeles waltl]|uniref:Uncharacterized protein n=1 Tax=Pleurodeles waltl TaxID=8319 RepID=A0AAV7VHX4_PLEWA|nr:hypothetical protein NDU88_004738 [Pleurodeles waltl]